MYINHKDQDILSKNLKKKIEKDQDILTKNLDKKKDQIKPPLHLPMPDGNRPEGVSGKWREHRAPCICLCPIVIDQREHRANEMK